MSEVRRGRHFRNLITWQRGQTLAAEVISLARTLRGDRVAEPLLAQLVRAAGSVPANIAEGYGRHSKATYRNHLSYARGSVAEVQTWLDLLARSTHLDDVLVRDLDLRYEELARVPTARMRERGTGSQISDEEAVYDA